MKVLFIFLIFVFCGKCCSTSNFPWLTEQYTTKCSTVHAYSLTYTQFYGAFQYFFIYRFAFGSYSCTRGRHFFLHGKKLHTQFSFFILHTRGVQKKRERITNERWWPSSSGTRKKNWNRNRIQRKKKYQRTGGNSNSRRRFEKKLAHSERVAVWKRLRNERNDCATVDDNTKVINFKRKYDFSLNIILLEKDENGLKWRKHTVWIHMHTDIAGDITTSAKKK